MNHDFFAPYNSLAQDLLPHAIGKEGDGSHDVAHLKRVWKNVLAIQAEEGGDLEVLVAATLLHDSVAVEKDSSLRASASKMAAEAASSILIGMGWTFAKTRATAHAIEAHSFLAKIPPATLEAQVFQDADRLDALGMVGAARCFYVGGRLGQALYDPADPDAKHRPYDDTRFALDHFHTKLLTLADTFQTKSGARMARDRHARLKRFLADFMDEL